ncbi:amino acid/amide ABC transporter membrane protein 2 (HAAT family) [Planktotalea frisia]|mgnify:CR=1 FL=1|jgi:branched-chain amino acid transport system permease protein|uniref:Leucine/isoleucine/valine transporter permease subunit n=1 Tax=Planktotalea frisia TaxID=696762 RepID=A0A1L9NXW9_9RHOB|nr:branched-chain amino acid ABC transporter permease [Planktotalea frisia]OJI94032.1 leucine/isoleucine/valine transporter permease subunit [Planktotalea frisia]PZX28957.1 amino acid/amide ABC transporter membrane protein 2 (HAAT family) [Planktotalea frisia]
MINGNLKATYGADERVLNNRNKQAFVIISIALLAIFPLFADDYAVLMACKMGILLIAVVGVNVLTGYTGLVSLGHGAFVAIGAYATVILSNAFSGLPAGILPFIVVPLAVIISALIGIVVGLPSLRVKGLYLAVATLAASFIVKFLIEQDLFKDWTGGVVGINTPVPNLLGWELDTKREMYVLITTLAVVTLLAAQNLFRTRVGRAFIAIRDRDYSAEILGISLLRYKLMSFAISAAYCGLSGALFAYFYARILPEQFSLDLSLELVAALIVGGMGRTMGPVFGVFLVLLVPELIKIGMGAATGGSLELARYTAPVQEIVFGLLLVFFLLKEPLGINQITDRILRSANRWPFARG